MLENKIYSIPFPLNIIYIGIGILLFYGLFVFLLGLVGVAFISMVFGNYSFDLKEVLIMISIILCFEVVALPMLLNTYSPIKVDEAGLYVRIFFFVFKWHFIPWEKIKKINLSTAFGIPWNPVWVVRVSKMFFWFRLLSQHYRQGYHPCIIIHSQITGSDELVQIIEEKISQQ